MIISESQLRQTVRRVLKESLHSHMDGNLTDIVLHATHLAGEEYADITVHDVMITLQSLRDQEIMDHADPMNYDAAKYGEYFVSSVRSLDYDAIVEKLHQLAELGEVVDEHEDFFSLPGAR